MVNTTESWVGSGLRFALLYPPCPRQRWRAAGVFAARKRDRFARQLCPRESLVWELIPNHVELSGDRVRVIVPSSWYWAHATSMGNEDSFCSSIAAAVRVVCHAPLRLIVSFHCPHLAYVLTLNPMKHVCHPFFIHHVPRHIKKWDVVPA